MSKILLFGPESPTAPGEGVVTYKLAKLIAVKGNDVIWLYHGTDVIEEDNLHCIGIHSCFDSLAAKHKFLHSLAYVGIFLWCFKAYRHALKLHKTQLFTTVLSRIMPQYGHLPALWFKKKTGIRWIANWSDPMPLCKSPKPYGGGLETEMSAFMRRYLNSVQSNVDYNTFPSKKLCEHYLNYLYVNPEHVVILPHIIDLDELSKHEAHDVLRFYHIGGGLSLRNPTLFFRALKSVLSKDKYKDLKLEMLFIGGIDGNVDGIANQEGVSDIVQFVGQKPYKEALRFISRSDIVLILEAQMPVGIFLPSKLSDILGFHKPTFAVSPPQGVLHDLITTYGGGICTDCLNIESIASGLETLFDDWMKNRLSSPRYNTDNLYIQFTNDAVWKAIKGIIK